MSWLSCMHICAGLFSLLHMQVSKIVSRKKKASYWYKYLICFLTFRLLLTNKYMSSFVVRPPFHKRSQIVRFPIYDWWLWSILCAEVRKSINFPVPHTCQINLFIPHWFYLSIIDGPFEHFIHYFVYISLYCYHRKWSFVCSKYMVDIHITLHSWYFDLFLIL